MHQPGIIVIEARRAALGPEHPDFGGTTAPEALIEAKRGTEPPGSAPEGPKEGGSAADQLAQLKSEASRLAAELGEVASRGCALAEELAGLVGASTGRESAESEGVGDAGELHAREPGAEKPPAG